MTAAGCWPLWANLLRHDVLAELHTLLNFEHDAKSFLPLILCGQATLLDRLAYLGAAPLASRAPTHVYCEDTRKE